MYKAPHIKLIKRHIMQTNKPPYSQIYQTITEMCSLSMDVFNPLCQRKESIRDNILFALFSQPR